jgi:CheY-like chemotaxis protein
VLLIEDERVVREILLRMLGNIGITKVTQASSAEGAWAFLAGDKAKAFHVVITDLNLPGVSGAVLIKELRSLPLPRAKTLPIIVLTGDRDTATYKQVATSGISSYLIKPISDDMLRTAIARAVVPSAAHGGDVR